MSIAIAVAEANGSPSPIVCLRKYRFGHMRLAMSLEYDPVFRLGCGSMRFGLSVVRSWIPCCWVAQVEEEQLAV